MPSIETRNNDIEIRVIKPEDYQEVLDFLRIYYYMEEPLTVGSDPKQQDKEDEDFIMTYIQYGTCLMAVEAATNSCKEHIVGVLMTGPKGPSEADYLQKEADHLGPTKWGRTLQFLSLIEREANICKRFGVEKVLHVQGAGVDNKMRGQNIGVRLATEMISLAKQLKYKLLSADCTSYYSAKLCERMGFECINIKYYRDYLDENGKQVFKPNPPHECVKTYALELKEKHIYQ